MTDKEQIEKLTALLSKVSSQLGAAKLRLRFVKKKVRGCVATLEIFHGNSPPESAVGGVLESLGYVAEVLSRPLSK